MNSSKTRKIIKDDSFEDFEFFDAEGDLDLNLSNPSNQESADEQSSGISWMISVLCKIVEEQGWTIRSPIETIAATAVGALTGSLLGGPPGLAIGLLTGAVIAYRTSPRSSKNPKPEETKSTIRDVFCQMTLQQKKELIRELLNILKHSSAKKLIFEIVKNEEIRNVALGIMVNFLKKKMGVCLTKEK